jgi:hypothetical protein
MNKTRSGTQLLGAAIVAMAGSLALMPTNAHAGAELQVLGTTIGEWSATWWKWAQSIPLSRNPLTDADGQHCGEGQKGPVWFLGGTWGALQGQAVSRTCRIPAERSILFPIFTSIWVNTAWDNPNNTPSDMRACAAGIPGNSLGCTGPEQFAGGLVATWGPEPGTQQRPVVFDSPIVRSQSPFFRLSTYPVDSIWTVYGVPSSIFENAPSVSDGFWVMLPPPKPGRYVLKFGATGSGQDLTYHLIVGP